jgi:hypothetical protein
MSWYRNLDGTNAVIFVMTSTNTDASGFVTITHNMGWLPLAIFAMNVTPSTNFPVAWGFDNITTTQFRVRFMNASTAGAANAIPTGPQKFLLIR